MRVGLEPGCKSGEIAFIVADQYQHLGLGTKMVGYAIELCKNMKVERLYGIMLPENYRAITLMKKMGFSIEYLDDGTARATLNLEEEEEKLECPHATVQTPPSYEGQRASARMPNSPEESQSQKTKEPILV